MKHIEDPCIIADYSHEHEMLLLEPFVNKDAAPEKSTYTDRFSTPFDQDVFTLFLSRSIAVHKQMKDAFMDFYETDKVRFFNLAKSSPVYEEISDYGEILETDVVIRRVLGIIIASYSDTAVSEFVVSAMVQQFPLLEKITGNTFKEEDAIYLVSTMEPIFHDPNHFEGRMLCAAYIMLLKYPPTDPNFEKYLASVWYFLPFQKKASGTSTQKRFEKYKWTDSKYTHLRWKRQTIEAITQIKQLDYLLELLIKGTDDILKTSEFLELGQAELYDFFYNFFTPNLKRISEYHAKINTPPNLESVFKKISEDPYCDGDIIDTLEIMSLFSNVFSYYGIAPSSLFPAEGGEISPELRNTIYKILSQVPQFYSDDNQPHFKVHLYVLALIFYWTAQTLVNDKDLYFKNNSESQYYALHSLNVKIEELTSQLDALVQENGELKELLASYRQTVDELTEKLAVQIKQISAAEAGKASAIYKAKIDALESALLIKEKEILRLQTELEKEREKNKEVDRLRELVFEIEHHDIPNEDISLDEILGNKKIFVIGGHINWRNKTKSEYPLLQILDGHLETMDTTLLLDADLVIFNTANMSHAVYYKVMNTIRSHHIAYDYLGRATNANLLEKEIAFLIKKHL